ncbi:fungal-specific transcription factor domain-containing protein [Mariannaea sp. PMI_226]|nr:fungal-specific transcription factor domain-containing protein [Mariannaea sp. PMI_226]
MASLKNIINSDDDYVDPSSETSMQPLPPTDSSATTANYSTTRADRSTAATSLHNDLIDPARHSSRFFACEPPSGSVSADVLLGRRRSNTSVESLETPYDPNYVMPSGSNFMRPIQRNPPAEPPIKLTPITGKISKARKGLAVHNCDKCPKTFTRAEHLRRHQLTHAPPELHCPKPKCAKTFYRKDLLERHLQRHEIDDPIKNDPNRWSRYRPKTPPLSYGTSQQESGLRLPQDFTNPRSERSNSASGTTTMAPGLWSSTSGTSEASPNHAPRQNRPTEDYSLQSLPSELLFGQTSMPTMQPTTTASFSTTFAEPRTVPELSALFIPELSQPWQDNSTMPSSASESTYSTPSDNTQRHRLPARTSSGEWPTQMPLYQTSNEPHSPVLDNATYQVPFTYAGSPPQLSQLAFGDTIGLQLPGYLEDSLFNPEQIQATVRSMPPQLAVGQSSETLVTLPSTIPTPDDYPNGTGCDRPQGLGILAHRNFDPVPLSRAARDAIPSYLEVYWQKVHPLYPIVHRATFDSVTEDTAEVYDLLRCAMAAVAAQYIPDKTHRMRGAELHNYAWHKSKVFTQADEWPRPVQQTLLILEHYSLFRGKNRESYKPSPRFGALCQRVISNQNPFAPIPTEHNVVDQWVFWVDMETRRRLLAACFILDVHSARYHERQHMCLGVHGSRLPIPLLSGTEKLWEASTPQEWIILSRTNKQITLEDINLTALTPASIATASPFDGAIMLAGCALRLAQRQNHKEPNLVEDVFSVCVESFDIARLFPTSAVANTYLALHHTPLHVLLSVSGDTWVFNEKVSSKEAFSEHKKDLSRWRGSGNAAVAVVFAARALKAFFLLSNAQRGTEGDDMEIRTKSASCCKDISDYWGIYVCALICWAFGYAGKRAVGAQRASDETAAVRWIMTVADMEPVEVRDMANDDDNAYGVLGLAREELEAQCLGERNILLLDAVGVLKELEHKDNWDWF